MRDIELSILALNVARDFATEIINNPLTPPAEKLEYEKYLKIFTQGQKVNMQNLISNY